MLCIRVTILEPNHKARKQASLEMQEEVSCIAGNFTNTTFEQSTAAEPHLVLRQDLSGARSSACVEMLFYGTINESTS